MIKGIGFITQQEFIELTKDLGTSNEELDHYKVLMCMINEDYHNIPNKLYIDLYGYYHIRDIYIKQGNQSIVEGMEKRIIDIQDLIDNYKKDLLKLETKYLDILNN